MGGVERPVARSDTTIKGQGMAVMTQFQDNQATRDNRDNGVGDLRPFRQITQGGERSGACDNTKHPRCDWLRQFFTATKSKVMCPPFCRFLITIQVHSRATSNNYRPAGLGNGHRKGA
jgi:hypothetical protein